MAIVGGGSEMMAIVGGLVGGLNDGHCGWVGGGSE